VQQVLNPGLANYPNFVAGEAVKEAVSPDGKTLAILTGGMNSLFNSSGNVDTAASTQFLFHAVPFVLQHWRCKQNATCPEVQGKRISKHLQ
jgi:hypothetical protein